MHKVIRFPQHRLLVSPLVSLRCRTIPFQHYNNTHRASSHHATMATEECVKPFTRKLVVRGVTRTTAADDVATTITPQHQPVDVYVTRNAAHVRSWIQTHLGMSPPIHDQNHHQESSTAIATATTTNSNTLPLSTVVGFDVEWRPNFSAGGVQNKTALVQLASHTSALLIQMKPLAQSQSTANTLTRRQGQGLGQGGKSIDDDHRELLQVLGWVLNSPHVLKVTSLHTLPTLPANTNTPCHSNPTYQYHYIHPPIASQVGVGVAEDLGKLQRDFGLPFCHFLALGVAAQVNSPSSYPSSYPHLLFMGPS